MQHSCHMKKSFFGIRFTGTPGFKVFSSSEKSSLKPATSQKLPNPSLTQNHAEVLPPLRDFSFLISSYKYISSPALIRKAIRLKSG